MVQTKRGLMWTSHVMESVTKNVVTTSLVNRVLKQPKGVHSSTKFAA